jgi:hypothetical protein
MEEDYYDIIGKYVTYNGITEYAKDRVTEDLMIKYLVPGESYMVDYVRKSGFYKGYYVINHCYYPKESFYIDNKNFMRNRYNLK